MNVGWSEQRFLSVERSTAEKGAEGMIPSENAWGEAPFKAGRGGRVGECGLGLRCRVLLPCVCQRRVRLRRSRRRPLEKHSLDSHRGEQVSRLRKSLLMPL